MFSVLPPCHATCPCAVTANAGADSVYRKEKIQWECDNGGQLWTDSVEAGYETSGSFPSGFCASGFSNLNAAFIGGLAVDLVFQVRAGSR